MRQECDLQSINTEHNKWWTLFRKASLRKSCSSLDLKDEEELAKSGKGRRGKEEATESRKKKLRELEVEREGQVAWLGEGHEKRPKKNVVLAPPLPSH